MRKLIYIFISMFITTLFILLNIIYDQNDINGIIIKNYENLVNIEFKDTMQKEDRIKFLEKISKKYKINIAKIISNPKKGKIVNDFNIYTIIGNEELLVNKSNMNGLDEFLTTGKKLSNKNGENSLVFFNNRINKVSLEEIGELKNRNEIGEYRISISKEDNIDDLIVKINGEYKDVNLVLQTTTFGYTIANFSIIYYFALLGVFVLLIIVLTYVYYLTGKIRDLSIEKLYGLSTGKIVNRIFKKDILTVFTKSFIVIFVLELGYIFYVNKFSFLIQFLISKEMIILVGIIVVLIGIICAISYLIVKISLRNIVINIKRASKMSYLLSFFTKFLFSILSLVIFVTSILVMEEYTKEKENAKSFEKTENYGEIGFKFTNNELNDDILFYKILEKMEYLWNDINQEGCILMGNKNILPNEDESYQYYGEALFINDNYIKDNPILDESGENLGNYYKEMENDNTLVVLVPEKYKKDEETILKIIKKTHASYYRGMYEWNEDAILIRDGKIKPEDTINNEYFEEYLLSKYTNLRQKIIYIKDEQELFTYDTFEFSANLSLENFNKETKTVKDYLLFIVNEKNIGNQLKGEFLMSGEMKFKFEDIDNSSEGVLKLVEKNGLSDKVVMTQTSYDVYGEEINRMMTMFLSLMVVSIIGLAFYIVSSYQYIVNYVDSNRKKLSVLKLYGIGFGKRHKKLIVREVILKVITGAILAFSTVVITIYLNGEFDISFIKTFVYMFLAYLIFNVFDIVFTYIYVVKNEQKNIYLGIKGK